MDFSTVQQMLNPKVRIISSSKIKEYASSKLKQDYIEIGGRIEPSSKYYLLSYQFSENVNNFSGNFTISIYEDIDTKSDECIFSRVKNLDIVLIYEDSEKNGINLENKNPVFIGVIHNKNMNSMLSDGKVNRVTSISGTGIYSLIGDLTISLDIHTLPGVTVEKIQKSFTTSAAGIKNYKDFVNHLWNVFVETSKEVCRTSGMKAAANEVFINTILGSFFGSGGAEKLFKFENMGNIRYPVEANFWIQSVNNFSDMLRTLLPSNVFEIFGRVEEDGKPYLTFREVPFSPETWEKLKITEINPLYLTGYSISQSDSEVYNAFLAYIEGSSQDLGKYLTLGAIENKIEKNEEKMSKYGYRPLQVSFRGYDISQDLEADNESKEAIKVCTQKIKEWYGALDELYSGTISLVRGAGDSIPKIGEKIKFINYEFYVNEKSHSWSYGSPVNVTLNISRGGYYNKNGQRDTTSADSKEKFGCRYAELQNLKY